MSAVGALKVVDFSRVLAGPFATMLLGDLGAEVIKVERPGGGDDTRSWGPPYDERGQATYFQAVNRNKASVLLDLRDPLDLARARELLAGADVLVENFKPGTMDRLGLGFDAVHAANPGLVYCSISGFGSGAGAELAGYDLLVQALGGLMSITGEPDGDPQKVGVALVDVLAGLYATVGILAALRHRDQGDGKGQLLEIDLLSSLLASLVNQASTYTLAGLIPRRMGNSHPSIAPYDLYATGDGDLILAVGNDGQFKSLCETIAGPHLASEERFATNSARVAARAALRAELEERLATKSAAAWAADLQRRGVPAGTVNDIGQAFGLAEQLGLSPIIEVKRPDGTSAELVRNPIRLSETPPTYRTSPPDLPRE